MKTKPVCCKCRKQQPRMVRFFGKAFLCGDCIPIDPQCTMDAFGLTEADLEGRGVLMTSQAETLAKELGRTGSGGMTFPIVDEDYLDDAIPERVKRHGLNLREIPPGMWEHAVDRFEECDAGGLLILAQNTASLAIVADNMHVFKQRGIYENALIFAFTGTRTNHSGWNPEVIQSMFAFADRDKLRAAGDALPGDGPFTIYRGISGVGRARRPRGLSWTSDLARACWFANRFDIGSPAVVTATVEWNEVYFCSNGRHEHEFVTRPKTYQRVRLTPDEIRDHAARATAEIRNWSASLSAP